MRTSLSERVAGRQRRSASRLGLAVCLGMWLTACGMAIHGPQQTYSQSLDTASSGCRQDPALCIPQPGEQLPTIPSPPSPSPPAPLPPPLSAAPSAALSIGAAGRVVQVVIDATLMARIRKALAECADDARSEVMLRHFGDRGPTREECNEVVGVDGKGESITRAMQLGVEQHELALKCAQERLNELKPGGFSLSPRYRLDPRAGRVRHLSAAQVQELLETGRSAELRGSLEPDIVIHSGSPLQIQAVFDFKFPCVNGVRTPWRQYPKDHPYGGQTQKELYMKFLSNNVFRVLPRWGVLE